MDIDYWVKEEYAASHLNALVMYARQKHIPVHAVMNHQQLLPYVNASRARRLINIDEHSDATAEADSLHCGSWVSYVKWRYQGEYVWIRNAPGYKGCCNKYYNQWWTWARDIEWDRTSTDYVAEQNLVMMNYLTNVVGIGICMSPWYSRIPMRDVFKQLVRKYNLPYKKGRIRENNERRITPAKAA